MKTLNVFILCCLSVAVLGDLPAERLPVFNAQPKRISVSHEELAKEEDSNTYFDNNRITVRQNLDPNVLGGNRNCGAKIVETLKKIFLSKLNGTTVKCTFENTNTQPVFDSKQVDHETEVFNIDPLSFEDETRSNDGNKDFKPQIKILKDAKDGYDNAINSMPILPLALKSRPSDSEYNFHDYLQPTVPFNNFNANAGNKNKPVKKNAYDELYQRSQDQLKSKQKDPQVKPTEQSHLPPNLYPEIEEPNQQSKPPPNQNPVSSKPNEPPQNPLNKFSDNFKPTHHQNPPNPYPNQIKPNHEPPRPFPNQLKADKQPHPQPYPLAGHNPNHQPQLTPQPYPDQSKPGQEPQQPSTSHFNQLKPDQQHQQPPNLYSDQFKPYQQPSLDFSYNSKPKNFNHHQQDYFSGPFQPDQQPQLSQNDIPTPEQQPSNHFPNLVPPYYQPHQLEKPNGNQLNPNQQYQPRQYPSDFNLDMQQKNQNLYSFNPDQPIQKSQEQQPRNSNQFKPDQQLLQQYSDYPRPNQPHLPQQNQYDQYKLDQQSQLPLKEINPDSQTLQSAINNFQSNNEQPYNPFNYNLSPDNRSSINERPPQAPHNQNLNQYHNQFHPNSPTPQSQNNNFKTYNEKLNNQFINNLSPDNRPSTNKRQPEAPHNPYQFQNQFHPYIQTLQPQNKNIQPYNDILNNQLINNLSTDNKSFTHESLAQSTHKQNPYQFQPSQETQEQFKNPIMDPKEGTSAEHNYKELAEHLMKYFQTKVYEPRKDPSVEPSTSKTQIPHIETTTLKAQTTIEGKTSSDFATPEINEHANGKTTDKPENYYALLNRDETKPSLNENPFTQKLFIYQYLDMLVPKISPYPIKILLPCVDIARWGDFNSLILCQNQVWQQIIMQNQMQAGNPHTPNPYLYAPHQNNNAFSRLAHPDQFNRVTASYLRPSHHQKGPSPLLPMPTSLEVEHDPKKTNAHDTFHYVKTSRHRSDGSDLGDDVYEDVSNVSPMQRPRDAMKPKLSVLGKRPTMSQNHFQIPDVRRLNEDQKVETADDEQTEEELDIDLTDPELNKAATKIQASFRGHKVRKEVEN